MIMSAGAAIRGRESQATFGEDEKKNGRQIDSFD
jgi:hypothetical protein